MDRLQNSTSTNELLVQSFAQAVKEACIEAAISGYERASISGLCHEGAFEAAISAVRMLDVNTIRMESS